MPTEIVLLSEVEVTSAVLIRAVASTCPDVTFIEYRGGQIRQFVDARGVALLQVYRSRPVIVRGEAATALRDPPTGFALWTDMAIPFGDATAGRALAQTIATAVGGVIKDRT